MVAAALAADEFLCAGRSFGERILAVHVLHEILAEGYQEEDAQYASQQGRQKYLQEVDFDVGILALQDEEGGQREDSSRHNHARTSTNALNDDVLAKRVFAMGSTAEANGNDGDRYGCLEDLTHFEA